MKGWKIEIVSMFILCPKWRACGWEILQQFAQLVLVWWL